MLDLTLTYSQRVCSLAVDVCAKSLIIHAANSPPAPATIKIHMAKTGAVAFSRGHLGRDAIFFLLLLNNFSVVCSH